MSYKDLLTHSSQNPVFTWVLLLVYTLPTSFTLADKICTPPLQTIATSTAEARNRVASFVFHAGGHVDLFIDGNLVNATFGNKVTHSEKSLKRAAKMGIRAFSTIDISLTEKEFSELVESSKNGRFQIQSCVGGACKLINRHSPLAIPKIITQIPSWTQQYFLLKKKFGIASDRLGDFQYWGKNAEELLLKDLKVRTLRDTAAVTTLASALSGLTYFVINSGLNSDDPEKNHEPEFLSPQTGEISE